MQNTISENDENNKTLTSSSAASITEPITKSQNGQTKKVSNSEHLSTLKRPYGSMPNLTSSLTTGGDTAAVQAPTAVPVQQDVSAESQNGQTKKVSTIENVSTLKRPYGSMPNLTASITTGGDTAAVQAPTAVPVQQVSAEPLAECCPTPIKLSTCKLANYAGSQMPYYIGLVNAPPAAAGEVDEIRLPSVTSDRHISAESKHDGSDESDAKTSRDFVGRPPRRLWRSMPNIALHYTDKVFYDTTDIECITPMQVSRESLKIVIEPAVEVTPVKTKRCSLWKRARKFARRVFCCAA